MPRILITGGLGFVGSHFAMRFLEKDYYEVILFDNMSDASGGALKNFFYLTEKNKVELERNRLRIILGDIRSFDQLKKAVQDVDVTIHAAAQVAMTSSLEDPRTDFETNAIGSFNVLEAARLSGSDPILGYTSTNKVYGTLDNIPLVEKETRWDYPKDSEYYNGITEDFPLDIAGPYGCSKAAGDMYFRDYAKTYGLKSFVFRMSATYGELQYTTEIHGWIGWLLSCAYYHKPVTIYGDGKQVRGVLHVSDLARGFELAIKNISRVRGHAFNMGGDRENSFSILELLDFIKKEYDIQPSEAKYSGWRKIDQKCFIPSCKKALEFFGWKPEIAKEEGVKRMYNWISGSSNKNKIA